jgi:membrane protein implicated in regulation of membrane protease activity
MKSSKLFSLNIYDFLKGLIIAILSPIIVFAQGYFANGTLDIEWQALMAVGLSGLLAYLIKNFFSDAPNESRLTTSISKEDINAVVGHRPNDRAAK